MQRNKRSPCGISMSTGDPGQVNHQRVPQVPRVHVTMLLQATESNIRTEIQTDRQTYGHRYRQTCCVVGASMSSPVQLLQTFLAMDFSLEHGRGCFQCRGVWVGGTGLEVEDWGGSATATTPVRDQEQWMRQQPEKKQSHFLSCHSEWFRITRGRLFFSCDLSCPLYGPSSDVL